MFDPLICLTFPLVTPSASKLFARRPTWGPNWVEDPLASAGVTMIQQGLPWSAPKKCETIEHKAEKQRRNQNLSPLKPTIGADTKWIDVPSCLSHWVLNWKQILVHYQPLQSPLVPKWRWRCLRRHHWLTPFILKRLLVSVDQCTPLECTGNRSEAVIRQTCFKAIGM